jgi:DNA (cytosine-5)-methyltransferase 1
VLGTLAELGYGVAWRVLDSRFFGVPQRRRRVFIVGAVADGDPRAAAGRAGAVLAVGSRCPGHPATRGEAREDVAVASLSGLGSGGPDDNDGQANRVIVAHTLRSEGADASEDGTGRGTPLVAAPLVSRSSRGNAQGNSPGHNADQGVVPYTFDWQAGGSGDTSWRGKSRQWIDDKPGGPARALVKNKTLAVHITQDPISGEQAPAMGKGNSQGCATIGVSDGVGVRRLTARECERLQGLPDDWTKLDDKTPDSRRYSALGDAVTATVAQWIGERLG